MARRLIVGLAALLGAISSASAHVLDEYLQATLVVIEPGEIRLKINLTPGVEIADKVLVLLDQDGDGAISRPEADAYAERVRGDLTVRLDGEQQALELTGAQWPDMSELHSGQGVIQLEFALRPSHLRAGSHRLTLENRHFDSIGAYLFNAARPRTGAIQIHKQHRNRNQSAGEIEFTYQQPLRGSALAVFLVMLVILVLGAAALVRRLKGGWRSLA